MKPTVNPERVDFGAVAPGKDSPIKTVSIADAPSDVRLTARINGGDSSFFRVVAVSNFERTLVPVDPSELPHGFKGHPKHIVIDQVGQSDGITPLSVSKGQLVTIDIAVTAPLTLGGRNTISSTLLIEGDTWDLVAVPLSMLLAHIVLTFPSGTDLDFSLGLAFLPISLRSVAGPQTTVTFSVIPRPDLSEKGISLKRAQQVILDQGATTSMLLPFDADGTVIVGQFCHLGMSAFDNTDGGSFVLRVFTT